VWQAGREGGREGGREREEMGGGSRVWEEGVKGGKIR
jgi:hypothetical protein